MHETGDLETAGNTMPTHTTIDHLDDALERLANAERENRRLRAMVAELEQRLNGAKLAFQLVSRRPLTDAEKALADDIEIEPETVAMMREGR